MATRPTQAQLRTALDVLATLALVLVALSGWWGTFEGATFLVVGALGTVLGIGGALLAARVPVPEAVDRRVPRWLQLSILTPVVLLLALPLLGPPAALFGASSGPLPSPSSWGLLFHTLSAGWKEMLTTLPPVDSSGRYMVLPLVLGAVAGAAIWQLRRAVRVPLLPVVPAFLLVGVVTWLGVTEMPGATLRGLLVAAVVVAWVGARSTRRTTRLRGGELRTAVTGAVLLALVAGIVGLVGGAAPADPVLLRGQVAAPVDVLDRPSPLASFRRFRPVTEDLADEVLLRVEGLPAPGESTTAPVRIATLDRYSGTVWAAGGAEVDRANSPFLRLGTRIPSPVPEGARTSRVRIEIGEAYARTPDLAAWLPLPGRLQELSFDGARGAELVDALRYNPQTGAAATRTGVRAGDTYTVETVAGAVPVAPPGLDEMRTSGPVADPEQALIVADLVNGAADGGSALQRLDAVAESLRTQGAYTDGAGEEAIYTPGHGIGRLTAFLTGEPAGNDEQYAATLALSATYLGLPARVVLGARPAEDGTVRGADVRTWVEVDSGGGRWRSYAPEQFIPERTKRPKPRTEAQQFDDQTAVVPPPNAQRPPSSLDEFQLDDAASNSRKRAQADNLLFDLPVWLRLTLQYAGPPLGLLVLLLAGIVTAKVVRRRGRRRRGTAAQQIAGGWSEIVDTLVDYDRRDLRGVDRTDVHTRVPELGLGPVVARADRLTYGPRPATEDDVDAFWEDVTATRARIRAEHRRRTRLRGLFSWRSLRPRRTADPDATVAPSQRHESQVRSFVRYGGEQLA